ncbi:hypothetical protein BGZ54_005156 [Gamsiella multidivaricata]|nr:hypothetical protein BGZ54_005156 [Gamsiella multidivaricata]
MVFVNGQKFACATCIKGHRSTTCNHGERPLHEIKKKGRPSTQCAHCKELRKAKHVNARCICGREEGSAAVANGLKRAKSLSHDGRLSVPAAISGEDLLRSVSTQCNSPQNCSDALSSNGAGVLLPGVVKCGCPEGTVCSCAGRVVVKPGKSSSQANGAPVQNGFPSNCQRSTASLDLGKPAMLLFPRDSASPLPFPPHAHAHHAHAHAHPHSHGGQTVPSPDGLATQGMNGTGIYGTGASPLPVQTLSPSGSTGCDHSPSSSSMGYPGQMQPNLCFDYASSSDYDSDHYNPTTSYSYFPDTLTSYPVSNASDDMEDLDLLDAADSKKIMDGIMNGTTSLNPMESASADEIRMLYSALSTFSAASPSAVPTPPVRSYSSPGSFSNSPVPLGQATLSSVSSAKKGCCGSGKPANTASPASSILSHSPPAGRSDVGEDETIAREGCGCAISPNMCCCGERCACPGCLAYPNNQNILNIGGSERSASVSDSDANKNAVFANDMSHVDNMNSNGNLSAQALNLSAALSLIQSNGQVDRNAFGFDARQILKQEFSGMGLSGLDTAQMQHPIHLGDNGVLICGCGCGRPTVDCTECFRDMCQFVGEYQVKLMKDELELENALHRNIEGNRPELSVNMNMAMSMNAGMDMNMDMSSFDASSFSQTRTMPQTMSLLSMQNQRSDGSPAHSPSYEQQQQQQQQQHHHHHHHQQQQQQQQQFIQHTPDSPVEDPLLKQQQQQIQLAQQMQQRQSLRRRFREGMEEDQKLQLQLMEQEQMQLQQLQQSMPGLNPLQLDFLDNEDWSFVDEIRADGPDLNMNGVQRS